MARFFPSLSCFDKMFPVLGNTEVRRLARGNRLRLGFDGRRLRRHDVHRGRLNRHNREFAGALVGVETDNVANLATKQGLADRGLIRNDPLVRVAIPRAEDCVSLRLSRALF